ncbi:MAG: S-layer homology domain-containing protein [Clostridia bacterium]|nr:S-layer homology domain-containing protein [Clostridia bacterium]
MSRKFIALCLSALLILGASVNVFAATTEAVPVSGESAADFQNAAGGTNQAAMPGAANGTAQGSNSGVTNNDSQGNNSGATNESAQGNIPGAANNTANSAAGGTPANSSANQGGAAARATRTMDNSEAIVEQNQTKNNAMMRTGLYEGVALSRYSSSRVALAPDIVDTKYAEAAEILGALGIMVGDAETGNFRPNDSILRSEMSKVSVYSVGLEDVAKSSSYPTKFPDVVSNHWANGPINVAVQQGMVIGDDVGTFRPDDPVLFQEAVTIMVRALGYEPMASQRGGYPTGYMVVASENQMLKGITATAAAPATRGDIAQLVFNSLTVNLMEQTGFGSNSSYEVVDKTLLYDRLNVEKAYGQITGTPETTLTGGSTTAEDRIMINDKTFIEGDTMASQLLGYNVVYYARIDSTTDEKTLIAVIPQESKNNVLTIAAGNIVSVAGEANTNKTVSYWRNNDDTSTRTASIVANPVYIYNGKYAASLTLEQMQPASGNLILLDTDTNNVYDIVFVNHFTNLVVETVSSATGRVTDKYNNGSLLLDPQSTTVKYVLIRDGVEIEPSDLVEWNVISYTVSEDKELIKAYVSTDSILGTVTQISADGFKIDNSETTYKKAANYPNEIKLRDKGRFYFDVEGKVAAVDTTAITTGAAIRGTYGYLVGAAKTGTLDETIQFKVFTVAGDTEVIDGAAKIRLNDKYGLTPDEVLAAFGKDGSVTPQLITYETNSAGKLTGLDIAVDKTGTGTPNKGVFTKNITAAEQIYKSASGMLGNVKVTQDTVIFDIPSTAGTDTTRYAVRNYTMFSNNTPYDIIVYDLQEDFSAKAIIVTSTTGVTEAASPIVLVDEIAAGQNEDFDAVDIVYGLENGKRVELMSTDKSVFVKEGGKAIAQGDIFQYSTNAKGEVDKITVLFDASAKTTEFTNTIGTDLTTVYGKVTKKFSDSVNVSVNGTVKNYSTTGVTVYEYNSQRKNNNISVVTSGDIEVFEEGNEVRLFVKLFEDRVTEMVIVR